jgi:hypothetical protein
MLKEGAYQFVDMWFTISTPFMWCSVLHVSQSLAECQNASFNSFSWGMSKGYKLFATWGSRSSRDGDLRFLNSSEIPIVVGFSSVPSSIPIRIDPSLSLSPSFSSQGSDLGRTRGSLAELPALGLVPLSSVIMAAGDQLEGSIREDMGKMESRQGGGSAAADLPRSDAGKGVDAGDTGNGSSSAAAGEKVEKMMARLRLTAAEKTAVVIDDVDDLELVDPDRAFVGKVLSPNVLHLETIKSAMRLAWGNPRGLIFNTAGDNLFVAEFGSQADRDRVMEGSPWKVGKHVVLLKKVDADVSPLDVVFDRLAIWARIPKLPTRLMRAARGFEIAKPIGIVQKVEADELGRCWGSYMRVRVEVNVNEPLLRYVTVTSSRLQTSTTYEVQYERLPLYCFSCGLLGHSALVCANPAERD